MSETKLLKVGLCTIRNEEQYIESWAYMLYEFCDRVVALVDPNTSDRTVEILESKCPWVEIVYQDRSLGDSDNEIEGPTKTTIMHANKTKWIRENIADGDWFIEMAADERFHPSQYNFLKAELRYAFENGYDALVHRTMYEPVNVSYTQLSLERGRWFIDLAKPANGQLIEERFSIDWARLHHSRFQQKYPDWEQNGKPHHGFNGKCYNPLYSQVPIWHFHRVKYGTVLPTSWRDKRGSLPNLIERNNGKIPLIPIFNYNPTPEPILRLVNEVSLRDLKQQKEDAIRLQQEHEQACRDRYNQILEDEKSWPQAWKPSQT